jgi:hypothetical protein
MVRRSEIIPPQLLQGLHDRANNVIPTRDRFEAGQIEARAMQFNAKGLDLLWNLCIGRRPVKRIATLLCLLHEGLTSFFPSRIIRHFNRYTRD